MSNATQYAISSGN